MRFHGFSFYGETVGAMACVAFARSKHRGWPLWLVGAVRVVLCFHTYRGMARIPVAQFAGEAAVEEIARIDL